MWYTHAMEYYLAPKLNEIMPFEAAWMDLEIIIMNELSQRKTNTMYITYTWNLKYDTHELIYRNRNRLTDKENKLMVTKGKR